MDTGCTLLGVKCPRYKVAAHMCQVSLLPHMPSWHAQGHLQFTVIIFYNIQCLKCLFSCLKSHINILNFWGTGCCR